MLNKKAKVLWIGTRWSIYDPIGIRLQMIGEDNPRIKNIVVPALDENDESNFNYLYNVGFDTKYYREKRASYEASDDICRRTWHPPQATHRPHAKGTCRGGRPAFAVARREETAGCGLRTYCRQRPSLCRPDCRLSPPKRQLRPRHPHQRRDQRPARDGRRYQTGAAAL